jgi:SPP1 gp7 family putative phage head morphogenesis protein
MRSLTLDAKSKTIKGNFTPNKSAERDFMRALKKVARVSGHIVEAHVDGTSLKDERAMQKALKDYSDLISPWAHRQSVKLLEQVQKSNKRAYQAKSKAIGVALKYGVGDENTREVALQLQREQVELIRSIPLEAGLRAQKIAYEAVLHGTRAEPNQDTIDELQKQLGLSTEVAISRATLIARTETARANAAINQSRAMAVGSGSYRWHNSGDAAVRESHKRLHGERLQGKIFQWSKPPTLDDGMTGHPGSFPNCRCFAEPIFDDE